MPTCGNAAASTALPQPAKVSHAVPIASALHLRKSIGPSPNWYGLFCVTFAKAER
jgi:hypothetical protein